MKHYTVFEGGTKTEQHEYVIQFSKDGIISDVVASFDDRSEAVERLEELRSQHGDIQYRLIQFTKIMVIRVIDDYKERAKVCVETGSRRASAEGRSRRGRRTAARLSARRRPKTGTITTG